MTAVAEFAELRFILQNGPVLRREVARRVARIAAAYPAVSIRLRSGDLEVSGDSADSIAQLGWRRGADLDVSCTGPGAEKILRDIVSILDRPTLNDGVDG
ncbi:MAG: hypothetical protein CME00_02415 [Geminicoccus sp.]|nr:hypothetical protein [Geminicoccus sp.]HCH99493.1 hypothetical protein [Alphaproteobacteria bacterium]|tara:strand:+ start:280 stop:579 length:300 start_codon:yes stop_codon:yes gene_type:complete